MWFVLVCIYLKVALFLRTPVISGYFLRYWGVRTSLCLFLEIRICPGTLSELISVTRLGYGWGWGEYLTESLGPGGGDR